jgi:hypothetical protein
MTFNCKLSTEKKNLPFEKHFPIRANIDSPKRGSCFRPELVAAHIEWGFPIFAVDVVRNVVPLQIRFTDV